MPNHIPDHFTLELKVFTAANDQQVPVHVREIIREMWSYCGYLEEQLQVTTSEGMN